MFVVASSSPSSGSAIARGHRASASPPATPARQVREASPPSPGTPIASWSSPSRTPAQVIDLTNVPPSPPPVPEPQPDEEILDLTPGATIGKRATPVGPSGPRATIAQRTVLRTVPRETLQDRVFRKAEAIAQRRDARKKYKKTKNLYKKECRACRCFVNSREAFSEHIRGAVHKRNVRNLKDQGPKECKFCGVKVKTSSEFQRHVNGKRHKKELSKHPNIRPEDFSKTF